MTEEKHFPTHQIPLAAWLKSQGYKLVDIDTTSYPAIMTFEDSDALQNSVRQWELAQAEGNCNLFYDAYRMLVKRVRPSRI